MPLRAFVVYGTLLRTIFTAYIYYFIKYFVRYTQHICGVFNIIMPPINLREWENHV